MARLHDFDAESEETAIEIGRAREISKDPGWRDRFAWEQRRIKLYREADKLRIAAIREDDLAEARKLRRRANELERKARER
ncbi:MAG: hypothetical protein JSU87_15195 [Gemmatimonadota bacterium]|nr:MAG: hypothetical protein JSU87_15195 [Gemmatimonadota bacterium]